MPELEPSETLHTAASRWNEDKQSPEELLRDVLIERWIGFKAEHHGIITLPDALEELSKQQHDDGWNTMCAIAGAALLIDDLRRRLEALERLHQTP